MCPASSGWVNLFQCYNRQWNQVAAAYVSRDWTYLKPTGGLTYARNNANGQIWVQTLLGWRNITGMTDAQVAAVVGTGAFNYTSVRSIQSALGMTTLPSMLLLWPFSH
jgi:hypothetical protein